VFVSGKPLQPSLRFLARPGAYPKVEHLKGASLCLAWAVCANITQGWNRLPTQTHKLIASPCKLQPQKV